MAKWISVKDKLPEMHDYFNFRRSCEVLVMLVYTDHEEYHIGCFDQYSDGTTFFQSKNGNCWLITHETYWRYLSDKEGFYVLEWPPELQKENNNAY